MDEIFRVDSILESNEAYWFWAPLPREGLEGQIFYPVLPSVQFELEWPMCDKDSS